MVERRLDPWLPGIGAGFLVTAVGAFTWAIGALFNISTADWIGSGFVLLGLVIVGGAVWKIASEADRVGDRSRLSQWGIAAAVLLPGGLIGFAVGASIPVCWSLGGCFILWIPLVAFIAGLLATVLVLDGMVKLAGRDRTRRLGRLAFLVWVVVAVAVLLVAMFSPPELYREGENPVQADPYGAAAGVMTGVLSLLFSVVAMDAWLWGERIPASAVPSSGT